MLKYIDEFNSVSKIIVDTGQFEDEEIERVIDNLNEGSVFFDIGANVGILAFQLQKNYSISYFRLLKPVPNTAQIFKENINKNMFHFKYFLNRGGSY